MEWISVKDGLPEDNQWVIAYGAMKYPKDTEYVVRICNYNSEWRGVNPENGYKIHHEENWVIAIEGLCCYGYMENVTHWMPLPEKPHGMD